MASNTRSISKMLKKFLLKKYNINDFEEVKTIIE